MPKSPGLRMAVALLLLAGSIAVDAASTVGQVVFAKGVVTAHQDQGAPRVLGKDADVQAGDVITTGAKSFGVVIFRDGTRMALRANTVFKVDRYEDEPGKEGALMQLFRGGFRAVTGLIAKAGGERFKVRAPTATIGVRGTDFSVRICDAECRAQNQGASRSARTSRVVARVAFVKGQLSGKLAGAPERSLGLGGPIYAADLISTAPGGFAVLAFKDESRITLGSASAFRIEVAEFEPDSPSTGRTLLRFLSGSLRAATGLIARAKPANFVVETPTATIGVRGTGFDLLCQGDCGAGRGQRPESRQLLLPRLLLDWLLPPAYAQSANGLTVSVWQGSVQVNAVPVTLDQAFFFAPGAPPLPVPPPPLPEPRPDGVPVDQQKLFGVAGDVVSLAPDALVVGVNDGHVTVAGGSDAQPGEALDLGAGEAAVLGADPGLEPVRLDAVPDVVARDPVFQFADPSAAPTLELFQETGAVEGCFQ